MKPLKVKTSNDLGPQLRENRHRMVGQDGAFSIPLSDGSTLWFFGDTVVGQRQPGDSLWYKLGQPIGGLDMTGKHGIDQMLNNTSLISRDRGGANGLRDFEYLLDHTGGLRTLLPLEAGEHPDRDRIWCQHGIEIDGRLILSFIKVITFEEPRWPFPVGFEIVGSGLAVGSRKDWSFTRVKQHGSGVLWGAADPHFGVAFLRENGGGSWIYVYGSVARDSNQFCHIARVRADEIDQPLAYEYYAGAGWSPLVSDAVPVMDGMPSEVSVSWNEHLQCYLAVHSLLLTGKIVGRTSATPWGPWGEPTTLWHATPQYAVPEPYPPLIYAGKEHPTLSEDGGRVIYLTYIEFEEYFPHLIRVELE
jgi:Domain of unknown function (DUF4185)